MLVKLLATILVPLVCTKSFLELFTLRALEGGPLNCNRVLASAYDCAPRMTAFPVLMLFLPAACCAQVIGKLLRQIKPLADFRLANKKWFTIASSTFLIVVPMMKVSTASDSISEMAIGNLLLTILSAILLHLFYLACEQLNAILRHRVLSPNENSIVLQARTRICG